MLRQAKYQFEPKKPCVSIISPPLGEPDEPTEPKVA
jgi:hypothetical protein